MERPYVNIIIRHVAPRAGARIETTSLTDVGLWMLVAPRAGARIETGPCRRDVEVAAVAPRAGARIETWTR